MKFLEEIKKEICPDDLELKVVDRFIENINSLLKKSKTDARCVKGGSTAKGTFLKGDHDVDLFVIFGYKYKTKDISKILLKTLSQLKPKIIHGSRDYFQIKKGKMNYEIVPTLFVKDVNQVENVTDMSPHHVDWVNKRLNNNLRDDIRLTKKFCKAQKIYGAESYINGFSGHVIDILVIHYGGFLKLLKAASKWTPRVVIDTGHHWKDALKNIDQSKTLGPLIIVDPVQPKRNAAAAVTEEKFKIFIDAAYRFLKNPSKEFFVIKEFDLKKIKKDSNGKVLVSLKAKATIGKIDVVGAKLLKIHDHIKKQLSLFGFTVTDSGWKWDKKRDSEIYFLVKEKMLSKTYVREGPPLANKESCNAFKEKNKDFFEENKRLYANVDRKFRTAKSLVNTLIKEDFIKSKADKIKLI